MDALQYLARKLTWLFVLLFGLIALLFVGLLTYRPAAAMTHDLSPAVALEPWQPRDIAGAGEKVPPLVRQGFLLVSESAVQMGPRAENPEMRFAGNNLSCTNCHLKGGTQAGAASWVGVSGRFPQFGARSNRIGTLEDRINGCMERSMNGRKLPADSEPMRAMVAYMEWLGEDLPADRAAEFSGYAPIRIPDSAVDLEAGKSVYLRDCAVCHGAGGQGIPDPARGYLYPPLWGPDSYNDGAGMHRVITAAEFIRGNMPYGVATWDNPKLSDREAFDVAGYINSFERPHKPGTEADYPDLTLKPVSTPYGPWADDFPAQAHKFGPFPPIMAYYRDTYKLVKNK